MGLFQNLLTVPSHNAMFTHVSRVDVLLSHIWMAISCCENCPQELNRAEDISKFEKVQTKAKRSVKENYSKYSGVTRIINEFGWKKQEDRMKEHD